MSGQLAPAEVEYQFRDIRTSLTSVRNRLNSLLTHYGDNPLMMTKLREMSDLLNTLSGRTFAAQEQAFAKEFPHRRHAGEHEHW